MATFEYDLAKPGYMQLVIFDITGRSIATPVNEYQTQGLHKVQLNTNDWQSGIYFYRISSIDNRQPAIGKLVLVK